MLKSELALEAYGTIDELNSFMGFLIAQLEDSSTVKILHWTQNILFNIGSVLAKDGADFEGYPELKEGHVAYLEESIDQLNMTLTPLKNFILPGGSAAISSAHICRTVCRRAERRVVALAESDASFDLIIQFLNRLSDFFFILSRSLHQSEGIDEIIWDSSV